MWTYEYSNDAPPIGRATLPCEVWRVVNGELQKDSGLVTCDFVRHGEDMFITEVFSIEYDDFVIDIDIDSSYKPNHRIRNLQIGDFIKIHARVDHRPEPFMGLYVLFRCRNHPYVGVLPLENMLYSDSNIEMVREIVHLEYQWMHYELRREIERYSML